MNNENNRTRELNEVIGGADTDSLLVEVAELEPLSDEALGMVAGGADQDDSSSSSSDKHAWDPCRSKDPGDSKSYCRSDSGPGRSRKSSGIWW